MRILTFLSLIVLIVFSLLIFIRQKEQSELLNSTLLSFRNESKVQADNIYNEVRRVELSLNDLEKILNNSIEIQSENINNLYRIILEKHNTTDRTIRDIELGINQSFLDFIKDDNRKIEAESAVITENLENDLVLEKAFTEGILLYREKHFSQSRDVFYEALSLYPHDKEIRFYYLSSLFYAEPENAVNFQYLKDQLSLYLYDSLYAESSLNILASISLAEDDMESAYDFYGRLYEENETDLTYLRYRGMLAYQLGKYGEAFQSFRSYLHSHSDDTEINYFYGLSLFNTGRFEEALNQFFLVQKSDKSYGNIDDRITETKSILENS